VKLYRTENKKDMLDENKSFQIEGLNPGDTLFGFVQELQYTVFVTNTHNNKSCRLELNRTATLKSVKEILARGVGFNKGDCAFYKEPVINDGEHNALDENRTFDELGIPPLGNVYLRETNVGGF